MGAPFSWASWVSPDAQTNLWMSDTDRRRHLTGCTVIFYCRLFKSIYPTGHLKTRQACEIPAGQDIGRCRSGHYKVQDMYKVHPSEASSSSSSSSQGVLRDLLGFHLCTREKHKSFFTWAHPPWGTRRGSHEKTFLVEAMESLRATGTSQGEGKSCRVSCRVINAISFF